jgi:hypothetical protein
MKRNAEVGLSTKSSNVSSRQDGDTIRLGRRAFTFSVEPAEAMASQVNVTFPI